MKRIILLFLCIFFLITGCSNYNIVINDKNTHYVKSTIELNNNNQELANIIYSKICDNFPFHLSQKEILFLEGVKKEIVSSDYLLSKDEINSNEFNKKIDLKREELKLKYLNGIMQANYMCIDDAVAALIKKVNTTDDLEFLTTLCEYLQSNRYFSGYKADYNNSVIKYYISLFDKMDEQGINFSEYPDYAMNMLNCLRYNNTKANDTLDCMYKLCNNAKNLKDKVLILANQSTFIVNDYKTGNLSKKDANDFLEYFSNANKSYGAIETHDKIIFNQNNIIILLFSNIIGNKEIFNEYYELCNNLYGKEYMEKLKLNK